MMFKNVIVKLPCRAVCDGITSAPELGKPVYEKALEQHAAYIAALRSCGVYVTILPADESYPDSCFVEDAAVLTENCAIITNPGAPSRNAEAKAIVPAIEGFYDRPSIEYIKAPGTIEGGDVMRVGDVFYVGVSARTNEQGIAQFSDILKKHGYGCVSVPLKEVLHLKTGVNYIENNNLLISGEFVDCPLFSNFNKIVVPAEEAYAANCIWVNGTVIVPMGYKTVTDAIKKSGYKVLEVDTSEFKKIDGGLSCLSLRF